jgi:nitrogen fixation protein FixH
MEQGAEILVILLAFFALVIIVSLIEVIFFK